MHKVQDFSPSRIATMTDLEIRNAVRRRSAERSKLAKGAKDAGRRVGELPD